MSGGPLPEWYQVVMEVRIATARLEEKVDALNERFTRHLEYHKQAQSNGFRQMAALGLGIGVGITGAGTGILKLLGIV